MSDRQDIYKRDMTTKERLANICFLCQCVISPAHDEDKERLGRMVRIAVSCMVAPTWAGYRGLTPKQQSDYLLAWWRDAGIPQRLIDALDAADADLHRKAANRPTTTGGDDDLATRQPQGMNEQTQGMSAKQTPPVQRGAGGEIFTEDEGDGLL